MSGPVENAYRFRAPTRTSLVRRDRRPVVVANSAGRTGPVRVTDLPDLLQDLFALQLAASRAAIDLVRACDESALTGQPVHPDLVTAWLDARGSWRWMLDIRLIEKESA